MARKFLNELTQLSKDLDALGVNLVFNSRARAAEAVVKDLQKLSPAWTGKFRNSWYIESPTGSRHGGSQSAGEAIPVKAPVLSGADAQKVYTRGAKPFTIDSASSYKDQATDTAPFRLDGPVPPKTAKSEFGVKRGERPDGGLRGDVSGSGGNRSTAELNWFSKYSRAGKLDQTVKKALSKPFKGFLK